MKEINPVEFDRLLQAYEDVGGKMLKGGWICECGEEHIVYAPIDRIIHDCKCGIKLDLWLRERNGKKED
jgi:hypothetical protein